MVKVKRIMKGIGVFALILLALPLIMLKSGFSKIMKTFVKTDHGNKLSSVDNFVSSLSNTANADVSSGISCSSCSGCGCGHDSGGY